MFRAFAYSLPQIERTDLPGPSAVVCMADSPSLIAKIKDSGNVLARLDLVFNDSDDDFGAVRAPSEEDARKILEFVDRHKGSAPNIVFQCQVGVGRSLAAFAAVVEMHGGDPTEALHRGTHNRALHRKLLAAAGRPPRPEPLVSMVVRVKYSADRMNAFLLSMRRQRYDNWELVFVTDGPNATARSLVDGTADRRIKVIETEKALGRWGHPYRQKGIEACAGELVGLSNDDNYYVPGYLEQMVNALQKEGADLAMCAMLHSYWGWRPLEPGHDLGSWIARRVLVERTPWRGDHFFYDAEYLDLLKRNAAGRIAIVDRPLFIHN
ncbi:MAG: glycosyltransferase [Usitatibacter sp.]